MKPCVLAAILMWPSFHGCEEYVYFSEPQPAEGEQLATFPEEWRGCYRLRKDSAYVEVVPDGFTVTMSGRMVITEEDLFPDTTDDPVSALLKHRLLEGLQDTVIEDDGIVAYLHYDPKDGMLMVDQVEAKQCIGRHFMLKAMGDLLCLSHRDDSIGQPDYQVDVWEKRGVNIVTHILRPASLDIINRVVDLAGDTLSGPLTVTPKQFKRLYRKGAYQEADVLLPCAWCASSLPPR